MGNKKGVRHQNRRKIAQAINNIRTAEDYLVFVGRQYEGKHPDIYDSACFLVTACQTLNEAIDRFYREL